MEERETLHLQMEGFEGPLDLLLDLARAQKVNLESVSLLQVAEQYLSFVEKARALKLELAADWLVMAAWLAWLKSRLLLPGATGDEEAEEAAGQLQERLTELERMRAAAVWLESRPRLGRDVFARPDGEDHVSYDRSGLTADLAGLVASYLAARRRTGRRRTYAPAPRRYWTVQQARAALARLLGADEPRGWRALDRIASLEDEDTDLLLYRAARAGALVAGLEMAKSGALELRQKKPFGQIEWRSKRTHSF